MGAKNGAYEEGRMREDAAMREERVSAAEYIDFLKRTDLGSQYPQARIARLVETTFISLTDYAYWLHVTDLGVDRARARGRRKGHCRVSDRKPPGGSVL